MLVYCNNCLTYLRWVSIVLSQQHDEQEDEGTNEGLVLQSSNTTLCWVLNSAWIPALPLLPSTTNLKSHKYLYRLWAYTSTWEKLNFQKPLAPCSNIMQLLLKLHQKTNPKNFPFMIEIRVDFQILKDDTTNWSRTVSSWLQNGAFPQFDSRRVI